ncbi:MAG: class I SAM-dependent methyltransferase [Candidatus Geothermincolia bacterium]
MGERESRDWTAALAARWLAEEPSGHRFFNESVLRGAAPGSTVLDLGCGTESLLTFLKPPAAELIGLDLAAVSGPYDRYVQADLNQGIPLPDRSVDLAVNKFLLEHLSDPERFFSEVARVLRPQGLLVLLAPNIRYYPYAANFVLSRLLAQERRMRLVAAFRRRAAEDIFPVLYRCNTPRLVRAAAERARLEVVSLHTYADCLVTAVARPLGAVAVGYELTVNRLGLRDAKGLMVLVARRPGNT